MKKSLEDLLKEQEESVLETSDDIEIVDNLEEETLDEEVTFTKEELEEALENFDQLDELSKQTLGSYVKKATLDSAISGIGMHHAAGEKLNKIAGKKLNKRLHGVGKAVGKLTKEDLELAIANFDELEEANYPSADFKKEEVKGGKGGKADYPTVDFKPSVAKGGEQKPGEMPTVDQKGDKDGNTNKKTPVDPESYDKVKPNFDPEVVKQLTKEDISDETRSHLDNLFSGEELSEEFSAKVREIFEAAVITTAQTALNEKVDEIIQEYNDKFETALTVCEEEIEDYKVTLDEKADVYFNYVVEQWKEDNKPAIQSNIRTEMTESFINGLKNLFTEHYIDIPEDKVDIVQEMTEIMESLEAEKEQVLQENMELKTERKDVLKSFLVREHAKELSENEQEKFIALAEHISFDDEDSFSEKLSEISEVYFGNEILTESTIEDDVPLENLEEDVKIQAKTEVQKMADTMTKFLKK